MSLFLGASCFWQDEQEDWEDWSNYSYLSMWELSLCASSTKPVAPTTSWKVLYKRCLIWHAAWQMYRRIPGWSQKRRRPFPSLPNTSLKTLKSPKIGQSVLLEEWVWGYCPQGCSPNNGTAFHRLKPLGILSGFSMVDELFCSILVPRMSTMGAWFMQMYAKAPPTGTCRRIKVCCLHVFLSPPPPLLFSKYPVLRVAYFLPFGSLLLLYLYPWYHPLLSCLPLSSPCNQGILSVRSK